LTNYAIVGGVLFSTAMGVANLITALDKEWRGLMGAFTADFLARILGTIGASIVVITALFITMVLAIDLDVHKSIDREKAIIDLIAEWRRRRKESGGVEEALEPEV